MVEKEETLHDQKPSNSTIIRLDFSTKINK